MIDPELPLIFAFILTIIVVGLTSGYFFNRQHHRHVERKLELKARANEADAAIAAHGDSDYRKLKERVQVLERIATDGNHALASQIEELRALDAIEDGTGNREKVQ